MIDEYIKAQIDKYEAIKKPKMRIYAYDGSDNKPIKHTMYGATQKFYKQQTDLEISKEIYHNKHRLCSKKEHQLFLLGK